MKIGVWLLLLLAVAVGYGQEEEHHKFRDHYEAYKKKHDKDHHPSEHDMRLKLWVARHKFIEEHNASGKHPFTLGHNEFSDMTEEEKEHLAGYHPHTESTAARAADERRVDLQNEKIDESKLPASFDLRSVNSCVGPIKSQSPCASCWAMAATAIVEFSWCKNDGGKYNAFSEQDLVDCAERVSPTPDPKKCELIGNTQLALKYLVKNGGTRLANDYPYVGGKTGGKCESGKMKKPTVGSIVQYGRVPNNEAAIKSAIMKYGPIKAAIYSSDDSFRNNKEGHNYMHHYKDGVYSTKSCKGKPDHGVNIIGWGTNKDGLKYWLVRNSWGQKWGEKGYIKIERGVDMCGIESSDLVYAMAGPGKKSRPAQRQFHNKTMRRRPANHHHRVRLNKLVGNAPGRFKG